MATRPTPRSRTGASSGSSSGRRPARSPSPGSNSMPLILGGVGVLVVVVVLVMMNSGNGGSQAAAGSPKPDAAQPAAAAKSAPVSLAAAKAGKSPATPPPSLTQETLAQVSELNRQMKALYNEGVTARKDGDNQKARDKQAQAKDVLEQIDRLLQPALLWQEKAQEGDWSQPAEYVTLERIYGDVMKLANMVRKGGGK